MSGPLSRHAEEGQPLWCLVDPSGDLREVHPSYESVQLSAQRLSYPVYLDEAPRATSGTLPMLGSGRRGQLLAANPSSMTKQSLKLARPLAPSGLRIPESALELTPGEIEERLADAMKMRPAREGGLLPLPQERHRQKMSGTSLSFSAMRGAVLGSNGKMIKSMGDGYLAVGLSLLPSQYFQEEFDPHKRFGAVNLCVGASADCKRTCLVFSGEHTMLDPTIWATRARKVQALLTDPEAFGGLLYHAIIEQLKETVKTRMRLAVRLNVYSDIVWEEVFPALFDVAFERLVPRTRPVTFYDYTKVFGRQLLDNYPLTFSFAGHGNLKQSEAELKAGRNVAVAFIGRKLNPNVAWADMKLRVKLPEGAGGLPETVDFGSLRRVRVIDGDESDSRYLDPRSRPGYIVGLRYKKPGGKGGADEMMRAQKTGFVVEAVCVDGYPMKAQVPRDAHADPADWYTQITGLAPPARRGRQPRSAG